MAEPYATNLVTNPSAEINLDGYVAVDSTISQAFWQSMGGSQTAARGEYSTSCQVETDGTAAGQGVYTPKVILNPQPGDPLEYSASAWLMSSGPDEFIVSEGPATVYVQFVNGNGGQVLATKVVRLSEVWTRVTFDGLTIPQDYTELYLLITTVSPQVSTFFVDWVQIEQSSVSTQYTDGTLSGCEWLGEPHNSASIRLVQNLAYSDGTNASYGELRVLVQGKVFDTAATGFSQSTGSLSAQAVDRPGAFDDFAMYPSTEPDPAMTYVGYTNAGRMCGAYDEPTTRHYALFFPPRDYPVSNGEYAWRRAAYAAVGFRFYGITDNNFMYLDAVQLEPHEFISTTSNYVADKVYDPDNIVIHNSRIYTNISPSVGHAPTGGETDNTWWRWIGNIWGPTEYTTPRQMHTRVKPNVLNYVKNPSFESSTTYWEEGSSNTTMSRDNVSVDAKYGSYSLKVSISDDTQPNPGVQTEIDHLIVGRTYTASAYILGTDNINDIIMSCANGSVSLTGGGVPYGGIPSEDIGYGEGPYGGYYPPGDENNFEEGVWLRMSVKFTATSYTETLRFVASFIASPTFPAEFWIDAVMVEEGDLLHNYIDGSLGFDYLWEADGTPHESRSYWYDGRKAKAYILEDMVAGQVPLGITADDPLYARPPTQ